MKLHKVVRAFVTGGYLLLAGITALAQQESVPEVATDASPDAAAIAAADAAAVAVIQQPMVDYQDCIKNIIANDLPVADKGAAIAQDCDDKRRALQAVLPADFGDFLLLNIDRRINIVLTAMQGVEEAVADTVEDAKDIMNAMQSE